MTDCELLELAAKAAGIQGEWVIDHCGDCHPRGSTCGLLLPVEEANGHNAVWNPLKNDKDALRLALKLRLNVTFTGKNGPEISAGRRHGPLATEREGLDLLAATRRAVVRAAAEIGKTLPQ